MTEPNDIPAILARARWNSAKVARPNISMPTLEELAAEILSLRADKKRLDVLEELLVGRWLEIDSGEVLLMHHSLPELRFDSFTEAADAELSRQEKENAVEEA